MEEHLLFRIGRWQHSRTKQAGVYPPDTKLPPLVADICYPGSDPPDALARFLADHTVADVARWLDLYTWVDSLRAEYRGYCLLALRRRKCKLEARMPRRTATGRYRPGEDTRAMHIAARVRRERQTLVQQLAQTLLDEVKREAAELA